MVCLHRTSGGEGPATAARTLPTESRGKGGGRKGRGKREEGDEKEGKGGEEGGEGEGGKGGEREGGEEKDKKWKGTKGEGRGEWEEYAHIFDLILQHLMHTKSYHTPYHTHRTPHTAHTTPRRYLTKQTITPCAKQSYSTTDECEQLCHICTYLRTYIPDSSLE